MKTGARGPRGKQILTRRHRFPQDLVITDASIVRLQSTQANQSEDCRWPACAAYCAPCAKTNKYWTCLSTATQSQDNSECVMGACFAEPGWRFGVFQACAEDSAMPTLIRRWPGGSDFGVRNLIRSC